MTDKDNSGTREDLMARERLRYQWMLDSISKFRLFFVGLVFAMLSISVQFSVSSALPAVRWCQVAGWVLLLATAVLSLIEAGGFRAKWTEPIFDGLPCRWRIAMWASFIFALVFLMGARFLAFARPSG